MANVPTNEALNDDIKDWTNGTMNDIDQRFDVLDIKHAKNSKSPAAARTLIKSVLAYRNGTINKVSIKFPRHMVFVQKGVGKGTPKEMAGLTNRQPKDWFNQPVDEAVERLGDIVAEHAGNRISGSLSIK
jgi:hypothetical protein